MKELKPREALNLERLIQQRVQVKRKIDTYLSDVTPESTTWKAFADYSDQILIKYAKDENPRLIESSNPKASLTALEETRRQRANELPGYESAYNYVRVLAQEYADTRPHYSQEPKKHQEETVLYLKREKDYVKRKFERQGK